MNQIRNILFAAVLGLTLMGAGCNPTVGTSSTAPVFDLATAQRDVFAAKEAYGVSEALATAYAKLPRCATPAVMPCSSQAILDQITKARNTARAGLAAGQAAVDNPAFGKDAISTAVIAAQASVGAFTAIANTSGSK